MGGTQKLRILRTLERGECNKYQTTIEWIEYNDSKKTNEKTIR